MKLSARESHRALFLHRGTTLLEQVSSKVVPQLLTQPSVKPSASAVGIQASPCLGQGHRGNVRVKQMFLTVDSPVLYTAFNGRNVQEQSQRIL